MRKIVILFFIALIGARAQAQVLPAAPSAVLTPPSQHAAPPAPPPVEEKLALPQPVAPGIRFNSVSVSGAKAISAGLIEKKFAPLIGKTVSTAELSRALDAVNGLYADAGFALGRAYIPAQKMKDGVLDVRVLEGYVGTVVVRTDTVRVKNTIAGYADAIMASRPLRKAALDRLLRLIAEIPGAKVEARLTAMNLQTGSATLILTVAYHPLTTALALVPSTVQGLPALPYATISANDLLGDADIFSFTGLLSPIPKDEYFFQLGASTALGNDGWRIATTDFMAKARANGLPRGDDLTSTQLHNELQLSYPLMKSLAEESMVATGAYFARAGYDFNHRGLARDRYLAAYLQYTDNRQYSPQLSQSLYLRATSGFAFDDVLPHSRINASRDFARLAADGSLYYAPLADFGVLLRADAQIASGSLMAGEEDVYGGERFGRGYDSGVLSGDEGLGLTLQPQYSFSLAPDWRATTYVFGDYAHVANTKGDNQGNATLASAGLGMNVSHGVYTAGLGIAEPLKSFRGYGYRLTPRLFGSFQARI